MTPDHARKIETCARRIRILVDAGEYQAAREQIEEARKLALEALNEPEGKAA